MNVQDSYSLSLEQGTLPRTATVRRQDPDRRARGLGWAEEAARARARTPLSRRPRNERAGAGVSSGATSLRTDGRIDGRNRSFIS